ncbi:hypothetical protein [Amycolatopsis sp. NPDC051371]
MNHLPAVKTSLGVAPSSIGEAARALFRSRAAVSRHLALARAERIDAD